LLKFARMLRELAQLAHADRSPVSTVEDEDDTGAVLTGECERPAILIVQSEIRRGLQAGERRLRLGQNQLPCKKGSRSQQHNKEGQNNLAPSRHAYFAFSSLAASFIFAESSFFCTRDTSAGSTSAAMERFHSVSARSQSLAASFRRPVF
jgi:hypothetical protein